MGRPIIADNLSNAGWSWGCVSAIDSHGRTIFVAGAHRDDGKRNDKWGQSLLLTQDRFYCRYRISEPNSPSLTRVRIFIFGRTAAIVRIIAPWSLIVML
jgi:hypothetical protein